MNSAAKNISSAIDQAIKDGAFPGASVLVAQKGETLLRGFYGNATLLPKPEPVTDATLFDIASLTKPLATASLAVLACAEKGLSLSAPASKYVKELADSPLPDHRKITVRHLLRHMSGLAAWKPYFEDIAKEHPEEIGKRSCRTLYLKKIAAEPLEAPVAYRRIYSDLGFILLGALLENLFDRPLDELFGEMVAQRLELPNTFFAPVGSPPPRPVERFAATENSAWRKKLIRGEVHDDNAFAMGGVAGHAGLFSHVDDLHKFLVAWKERTPKTHLKLGWDTPDEKNSQAGRCFSKNSIGHLGYTGCSFWMDLDKDFHVILLTNRVHPSSQNDAIKQFRPQFHDLIYDQLINI